MSSMIFVRGSNLAFGSSSSLSSSPSSRSKPVGSGFELVAIEFLKPLLTDGIGRVENLKTFFHEIPRKVTKVRQRYHTSDVMRSMYAFRLV